MDRDKKARLLGNIITALSFAGGVLLIKILNDYERRISALEDAAKKDATDDPDDEPAKGQEPLLIDVGEPFGDNVRRTESVLHDAIIEASGKDRVHANARRIDFVDVFHENRDVMTATCVSKDDGTVDVNLTIHANHSIPHSINGAYNVSTAMGTNDIARKITNKAHNAAMKERARKGEAFWEHGSRDAYRRGVNEIIQKSFDSDARGAKTYSVVNGHGETPIKLIVNRETAPDPGKKEPATLKVTVVNTGHGTLGKWLSDHIINSQSPEQVISDIADDLFDMLMDWQDKDRDNNTPGQEGGTHD